MSAAIEDAAVKAGRHPFGIPAPAGSFFHAPRPPGIPGAIPDKRDYLAHTGMTTPANYLFGVGNEPRLPLSLIVRLNRFSPARTATLTVSTEDSSMNASIALKPDALRELARMCIDAAHDIEVNA